MGRVGCRLVLGQIYLRRERNSLIKDKKVPKKGLSEKELFPFEVGESDKKTCITIFSCPILSVHYWEFRPLNLSPKRTNYMSHCQRTSILIWQRRHVIGSFKRQIWNIKFCHCIVWSVTSIENGHWLLKKDVKKILQYFLFFMNYYKLKLILMD